MNATAQRAAAMNRTTFSLRRRDALVGTLVGTAVGDALGLPMEGLSARRQKALFPMPLRHRLIGRWGMVSDDTEHSMMLAQALLAFPHNAEDFQRDLARQFRWWLAGMPTGIGFATLRAILKLWLGISPRHSGVMSAGNGPAMRCAVLGVYFAEEDTTRREYVAASTQITHLDPRAGIAAQAVADVAAWMASARDDVTELVTVLERLDAGHEWSSIVATLDDSYRNDRPVSEFAKAIGVVGGVSGYAYQSVPVAIYTAIQFRHDFTSALTEAIACGGDTDTVAAITGALVGARVGADGIPGDWCRGICDFPRSVALLVRIAEQLDRQREENVYLCAVPYLWPVLPVRNLAFLGVVLAHGMRRLLPPY